MRSVFKMKPDKRAVRAVIFGVLSGSLLAILLMLAAAFLLSLGKTYPVQSLGYMSLAFLGAGGFFGGLVSSLINGRRGIAVGAVTGLIIFIIATVSGAENFADGFTLFTVYKLAAAVLPAMLGGIVGVNRSGKMKL